jgi:hypothetical protein
MDSIVRSTANPRQRSCREYEMAKHHDTEHLTQQPRAVLCCSKLGISRVKCRTANKTLFTRAIVPDSASPRLPVRKITPS